MITSVWKIAQKTQDDSDERYTQEPLSKEIQTKLAKTKKLTEIAESSRRRHLVLNIINVTHVLLLSVVPCMDSGDAEDAL